MLDFPGDPVAMHFQNIRENFDREIHKLWEVQSFSSAPNDAPNVQDVLGALRSSDYIRLYSKQFFCNF